MLGNAVSVSRLSSKDLPKVLEIEQDSFDSPWKLEEFKEMLRLRQTFGVVAEKGDTLAGYLIYTIYHRHIKIENLAVKKDLRREGIGRFMVEHLIELLGVTTPNRIEALVIETNLAAQYFLKACGFRAKYIKQAPYEDNSRDAYFMEYRDGERGVRRGFSL